MAEALTDPFLLTAGPEQLRASPLGHLSSELAATQQSKHVALAEIPFTTQIGLRAAPGSAAHEALHEATGAALPRHVGQVTGSPEGTAVLWLGPDEFLLIAPPGKSRLVADLDYALGSLPGQVVDLSANRTIIAVEGDRARATLEKGTPADLHPRSFPVPSAVATSLGPVPVLLWRTGDESYRVLPRASFADYTARWLLDASREFRR